MTKNIKKEQAKRKFCQTLSRMNILEQNISLVTSNTYIDDSGWVMIMCPDGLISAYGQLSLTGEFICKRQKMD